MEHINFMQEIYRLILDWLKKQASQVILLSVGIVFMYTTGVEQLKKLESKIEEQEAKIIAQGDEIRKCDMERASLETELNFMRYTLEQRFPNLKLQKFH